MRSKLRFAAFTLVTICISAFALADEPTTRPERKPTRPLTIIVLDGETNQPAPNAKVAQRESGLYAKGEAVDAEGKRTLACPVDHSYISVMCRSAGYVPTAVSWQSNSDKAVEFPNQFTVRLPKGKRIGGRVVDGAGKPVARAKVILYYWPDGPEHLSPVVIARIADETVETDADGRWSFDGYPVEAPNIGIRLNHPDYVAENNVKAPQSSALLDGSAVLKLESGVAITGQVVTGDGKPISGASLTTLQNSHVANDYGLTISSDAQGNFRFLHMRAEATPITVSAAGFAPELLRVNAAADMAPLKIALSPAHKLRGRVVDESGKPLAKAYVRAGEWRNIEPFDFSTETDADGRFVWNDAPGDAVSFSVSKEGYRYIFREQLTAGDADAVVKMRAEMSAHGTVIDAQTQKPIDKFRVVIGYALWEGRPPYFSLDNPQNFTGGKYQTKIDAHDEVVASYVRIEADGYQPAVSPPIKGGDATFNAQLHPGHEVIGLLEDSDGNSIAGATVHLVLAGAQVNIRSGKVDGSDTLPTKTDEGGQFHFSPQVGEIYFFVVHDSGYAFVKSDASAHDVELRLTPWSRIEGVYRPGGADVTNQRIYLMIDEIREPRDTAPKLVWDLDAKTDAASRYRVERAPSFAGAPATVMIGRIPGERRWLPIRLLPGQSAQVNVRGRRTLRGHALPASQEDALTGARGMLLLKPSRKLAAIDWPETILQAGALADAVYRCDIQPDGAFLIPSLPAGTFEYQLSMYSGESTAAASGSLRVESNDGPSAPTIIRYTRGASLKIGQPAPPTLGRTFDDKPIRTADYGGKVILVVVWDSCTGRSDEHIPHLNDLAERLADNPRLALISVNLDAVSCGMTGVPRRPSTLQHKAWVRGYLPMADEKLLTEIGGPQWPAIIVIGADGKVRATGLRGDNALAAVRAALGDPKPAKSDGD